MNLSFFTKIFDRSVQLSLSFGKTSTLGVLVSTKTKCIKLIFIGKITLVPVAFLMALSIYDLQNVYYDFPIKSLQKCLTEIYGEMEIVKICSLYYTLSNFYCI